MTFIDDATRKLLDLQFYPSYMKGLRGYMKPHGRPVDLYSDRHNSLTVNTADAISGKLHSPEGP